MSASFAAFTSQVKKELEDKIVSLVEFGSVSGEKHPKLSDIDLIVILKDKNDEKYVVEKIREIEKNTLKTRHSELTDYIEENFYASNDYTGVHLLIFSTRDFGIHGRPSTLKLKLMTKLAISEPLLLYHLKHESKVLFGKDFINDLTPAKLSLADRLLCIFPYFALLALVPMISKNKIQFKVWCFKTLKYHGDCLLAYCKLCHQNVSLDELEKKNYQLKVAYEYRYQPFNYRKNLLFLFLNTAYGLTKDLPFLWQGPNFFLST